MCFFCQTRTDESLQCRSKSKNNSGSGYATIAKNLETFHELGSIPMNIDLEIFHGIGSIESFFVVNKACWHKSCSLKFNNNMLQRASKSVEDMMNVSPA